MTLPHLTYQRSKLDELRGIFLNNPNREFSRLRLKAVLGIDSIAQRVSELRSQGMDIRCRRTRLGGYRYQFFREEAA